MGSASHRPRRQGLDTLRGLALISMILYHASWDLVYLFGVDWPWYRSSGAFFWQQATCWTFILLSGYCFHLGRRRMRRGWMAFGGGAVVTAVTLIAMPDMPVLFGVLTFLGSATLLTIPMDKLLKKIPAVPGLALSFAFFWLFREVNSGFLGFEPLGLVSLPACLPLIWGSRRRGSVPRIISPCCPGASCFGQGTSCIASGRESRAGPCLKFRWSPGWAAIPW